MLVTQLGKGAPVFMEHKGKIRRSENHTDEPLCKAVNSSPNSMPFSITHILILSAWSSN
jgi:hypothetical protein